MVTIWIIISMVFLVIWTIYGIQIYKSYIKRKVSKEKIIKIKKNNLIYLIVFSIVMIILAVCAVVYIDLFELFFGLLSLTLIHIFSFLHMYVASVRYLNYLEDNQDDIKI